ncbi:MAG TPA: aminotransferase class IV, partial [Gemmatimonadaceae bacterium]
MSTHKIWRDGTFVDWQDATIHVMSHVVHYGSSVFEGIRCYDTPDGPAIFRLQDHMRRFLDSCRIYRMPMRHSAAELAAACADTVSENELPACYIRPVALRTGEEMG